jgi:flagellar hook-length control protein FliK
VPHVASTSNVSNIQHNAALNQRERMADAPSPFAMLLDETTAPPPPPPRDQSARTQSNSSSSTNETRRPDRAEPDRPEQARTTDTSDSASDQPEADATEQAPRAEASEAIAEGDAEAPVETTETDATIDAVLAASVETPVAPAQPVAAVIAPPTDVSAVAPEAQGETSPGTIPAAATPAATVPPATPELIDAAAPVTADAVPPASTAAADAAAAAANAPATDAPATPVPATQPATASDAFATATTANATDAATATADNAVAPSEPDQTQPPPQPSAVLSQPARNAAAVAPTESKPADDAATSSQAPAPTNVATSDLQDGQRVAGTATTAQPDEQADAPTPESQAKENAERPQQARAVSDFVQAAKPTPDNPHLAHPQAGQDFGQSVAATAQAQRPDGTNPLGPQATAAVPIESIAVTIAARAHAGSSRFEIRLDPPELGRVQIHLTPIDGGVQAMVLADRPETQDLLRRHAEALARELGAAGYGDVQLDFAAGHSTPDPDRSAPEAPLPAGTGDSAASATAEPRRLATVGGLDVRL